MRCHVIPSGAACPRAATGGRGTSRPVATSDRRAPVIMQGLRSTRRRGKAASGFTLACVQHTAARVSPQSDRGSLRHTHGDLGGSCGTIYTARARSASSSSPSTADAVRCSRTGSAHFSREVAHG